MPDKIFVMICYYAGTKPTPVFAMATLESVVNHATSIYHLTFKESQKLREEHYWEIADMTLTIEEVPFKYA